MCAARYCYSVTTLTRLSSSDPGTTPLTPLKEQRPTLALFEGTRPLNRPADSPTVRVQPPPLRTATRPRHNTDPHGKDPNHSSPYSHSSGMQTSGTARSSVRFQAGAPPYRPCAAPCLCILHCPSNTYIAGTQDDQDQVDEQDKQEIITEIMKSWMDRLKLMSLIVWATIFAHHSFPDDRCTDHILCCSGRPAVGYLNSPWSRTHPLSICEDSSKYHPLRSPCHPHECR